MEDKNVVPERMYLNNNDGDNSPINALIYADS